jgi:hypothetical protein
LRTLAGSAEPPFGAPPPSAVTVAGSAQRRPPGPGATSNGTPTHVNGSPESVPTFP